MSWRAFSAYRVIALNRQSRDVPGANARCMASISGQIIHTRFDLTSPLKLIEKKFGLKSLTDRDADANGMSDCFDFKQKPLPADIITPDTKLDFSDTVTTQP